MTIAETLVKHNLEEGNISAGLKAKIKRYNKVKAEVETAKQKLPSVTDPAERAEYEAEIVRGEESLTSMNAEICVGIEKYAANAEVNARKAENLKKARSNRAYLKGKEGEGAEGKEGGTPTEPVEEPPVEVPNEPVQEPPAPVEKKKSNGVLNFIGGAIVVGLLAFVGIKAYNSNKE